MADSEIIEKKQCRHVAEGAEVETELGNQEVCEYCYDIYLEAKSEAGR